MAANKYSGADALRKLWDRISGHIVAINNRLDDIPAPYDDTALKADLINVRALLAQVRDALQNGDIDQAINLLDTFLLDEGVLE